MPKEIEDLRAQRELIQKHLNWLDAQISNAEAEGRIGSGDNTSNLAETVSKTSALAKDASEQSIGRQPVILDTLTNSDGRIEGIFMESSSISDVKNAKIGCFIIFAAATLLFLFLLFGLPYLMD